MRRLLALLRLRFAALDFAVDRDERWWFLEVNPNGQWLWLELELGLPLVASMVDLLTASHHEAARAVQPPAALGISP